MKKIILGAILVLLSVELAAAVTISEVMYAPNQTASETDTEWIEIFNNDTKTVSLNGWKVDGYNFDDVQIEPNGHLVIARELTDGNDTDSDSFESVWGNNDGIWNGSDGNYRAVDGYFALTTSDTVTVTDGNSTIVDIFSYNSSFGAYNNGRTLEKINLSWGNERENWAESLEKGGTPGKANSVSPKAGTQEIVVSIDVIAPKPVINKIVVGPDDSENNGTQVLPNANGNKTLTVIAEVASWNTGEKEVFAIVKGTRFNLTGKEVLNATTTVYEGNFSMAYFEQPTVYTINLTVKEVDYETTAPISFEYLPLLATMLGRYELKFGSVTAGIISNGENVTLKNIGNVVVNAEISGTNINSGFGEIGVDNIEVAFNSFWRQVSLAPQLLNISLAPQAIQDFSFRISVPANVQPAGYSGKVRLTSLMA